MAVGYGDRLAGGAKGASATFSTGGKSVAQIEWDFMFMDSRKFKRTYGVTKKQFEAIREKAKK
jgi:hypothetical protein